MVGPCTHLVVGPLQGVRGAPAAASSLVLLRRPPAGAVSVALVVPRHQGVGRPRLGHNVPDGEAQEPAVELRVVLAERLHAGLGTGGVGNESDMAVRKPR